MGMRVMCLVCAPDPRPWSEHRDIGGMRRVWQELTKTKILQKLQTREHEHDHHEWRTDHHNLQWHRLSGQPLLQHLSEQVSGDAMISSYQFKKDMFAGSQPIPWRMTMMMMTWMMMETTVSARMGTRTWWGTGRRLPRSLRLQVGSTVWCFVLFCSVFYFISRDWEWLDSLHP